MSRNAQTAHLKPSVGVSGMLISGYLLVCQPDSRPSLSRVLASFGLRRSRSVLAL
jgi:hypothetical protein